MAPDKDVHEGGATVGSTERLRTLPGLVVCGGFVEVSEPEDLAWRNDLCRLDPGELRWQRTPDRTLVPTERACCAVKGGWVAASFSAGT